MEEAGQHPGAGNHPGRPVVAGHGARRGGHHPSPSPVRGQYGQQRGVDRGPRLCGPGPVRPAVQLPGGGAQHRDLRRRPGGSRRRGRGPGFLKSRTPGPHYVVGYSFGAAVAGRALLQGLAADGAIFIAPPIAFMDLSFLPRVPGLRLIAVGDRDELCPLASLQALLAAGQAPPGETRRGPGHPGRRPFLRRRRGGVVPGVAGFSFVAVHLERGGKMGGRRTLFPKEF